jgi:hypothetical protein
MKAMCDSMNHTRIQYEVSPTAQSKSGQTRYIRVIVYVFFGLVVITNGS